MTMEESLVNVEFLKSSNNFIARIQSELGGMREYRSSSFEEVLEQVVIDLQEEFESSDHAPFHVGFRFSMNARMPSSLSFVEPTTPKAAVSKSRPAASGISKADRRQAFARAMAAGLFSRILRARAFVSSRSRSAGTTRFTRPIRSAVAA